MLLFMPLYAVINTVNNPAFSNEQSIIIQTVMSPEGYIDKSLYNKFWSDFKDPRIKREFGKLNLSKMLLVGQKIQYENFKSARLSIKEKRIVKTKELLELYKEAKNLGMDLQITKQNTDLFLKAAATKEAINKNGVLTYITDDLIDGVIINMDASFERIGMLLDQEWRVVKKERSIGKAKILWEQPFTFQKKEEYLNGSTIKTSSYTSLMSEDTFLVISEMSMPNSDTDLCVNSFAESLREKPLMEKRTLQK